MNISEKYFENKIKDAVKELEKDSRFADTREFIQHGDTSVFIHCICVAYVSCKIMKMFHIKADMSALIVGALMHDYFLYDWHDGRIERKIHGFTHPFTAAKKAAEDRRLSKKEENIIKRHMFPLVPIPPQCKEAWIVCIADKICATEETIKGHCSGRKMKFAKDLFKNKTSNIKTTTH